MIFIFINLSKISINLKDSSENLSREKHLKRTALHVKTAIFVKLKDQQLVLPELKNSHRVV